MGLAGFATIGTGLVAILIPGAELAAGDMSTRGSRSLKRAISLPKAPPRACRKSRWLYRIWLPRELRRPCRRRIPRVRPIPVRRLPCPGRPSRISLRSRGPRSRPMSLKTHRKIWNAQQMSCRRPRRRRRKQKSAPGLRIAAGRIRLRSAVAHACGNARGVWRSFRILRIRTMPRASHGSRKWRSIARRPITACALQTRRLKAQASRRRRSRRRARRSIPMRAQRSIAHI